MTRRFNGRPALPPKAKAEILEVLFANMEISGDEIAAILKKHHVSCDADGKAEPSEKVVDVLTWAYYDGFLRCINDQTLSYMAFSTATNTSDQSENVFSDANSKNIYDVDDFTAVCDPESILYQDGKVIYNAYFRSTCTRRSTGDSKQVENHRTIELVWEDGVWKVNRIAFLSEDDFNARNYAQLP